MRLTVWTRLRRSLRIIETVMPHSTAPGLFSLFPENGRIRQDQFTARRINCQAKCPVKLTGHPRLMHDLGPCLLNKYQLRGVIYSSAGTTCDGMRGGGGQADLLQRGGDCRNEGRESRGRARRPQAPSSPRRPTPPCSAGSACRTRCHCDT